MLPSAPTFTLSGFDELHHDPGRDADLLHGLDGLLVRQVRELAGAFDARHQDEPGKAGVVQEQDRGEGEVPDGDGVGGEPGIELKGHGAM